MDKEGGYEKIGELVQRGGGSLRKGVGGSQIASSVFLKHGFITIGVLFLSVKYSHLIDSSFMWFTFYYYNISISLKTSNILENKLQVFQRSDCTIIVHNYLYYNELEI